MGYATFQVVQKITCPYIQGGENYDMWKMLKIDEARKEHIEIILYYLCNLSVNFKLFLSIVGHYKDKIPFLSYKEKKIVTLQ